MKLSCYHGRSAGPVYGRHSRKYGHVLLFIIFSWLMQYCQPYTAQEDRYTQADSTSQEFSSENQVHIQYAKGFDITYHDHYKILHLLLNQDTIRYLLLPEGNKPPPGVEAAQVIRIPVKKLIIQSTTHIGLLAFLNDEDLVVGVDEADYSYHAYIQQKVAAGKIEEVGGGENLNAEKVLALAPDLLMVSGMPGIAMERYQTFIEAGIPVLVNTEWMESSLLGMAEWVKLIAALTNQENMAEEKFSAIESQYDSVVALASQAQNKPAVITGSLFQGSWYVPGGNSFRSHLLLQAGATWPWALDTSAVSLQLDFETMYAYGLKAAYWLNPGQVSSKKELLGKDPRFADFKSFKQNHIYNNNKRMNQKGMGNDYYESGIVNPHRILSDVVKILHPDLLPDYQLYYFQKIE